MIWRIVGMFFIAGAMICVSQAGLTVLGMLGPDAAICAGCIVGYVFAKYEQNIANWVKTGRLN